MRGPENKARVTIGKRYPSGVTRFATLLDRLDLPSGITVSSAGDHSFVHKLKRLSYVTGSSGYELLCG